MPDIIIAQGDDEIIEVPILDENDSAVDISTSSAVVAYLSVNNTVVSKYSLANQAGYGSLLISDSGDTVRILVKRSDSKNFPVGVLKASVAYKLADDDLESKTTEYSIPVGKVVKGVTKDDEL